METTLVFPDFLLPYKSLISACQRVETEAYVSVSAFMLTDPNLPTFWRHQQEEADAVLARMVEYHDIQAVRFFVPRLDHLLEVIDQHGFQQLSDMQFFVHVALFYTSFAASDERQLFSVIPPQPPTVPNPVASARSSLVAYLNDTSSDMWVSLFGLIESHESSHAHLLHFARELATVPCVMNADVWLTVLRELDLSTYTDSLVSFVQFLCQLLHSALDRASSNPQHLAEVMPWDPSDELQPPARRRLRSACRTAASAQDTHLSAFPSELLQPPPSPQSAYSVLDALANMFFYAFEKRGTIVLDDVEYDLSQAPLPMSKARDHIEKAFRVHCALSAVLGVAQRLGWMAPQETLKSLCQKLRLGEDQFAPGQLLHRMMSCYEKNIGDFIPLHMLSPRPTSLVPVVNDRVPIEIDL